MRRREFISLLGGAAAAWPLLARAQLPSTATPVVTLINARRADTGTAFAAEFRKGLSQTGFAEGQDVRVEYHWLDGHYEELPSIINDAVRRTVAVIATPGSTPASLAAKAATATIPIVFGVAEDPVTLGLVASLAQPGGNATGINFFASEIDAKRLGLMHEMLPKANRFAVLINPANHATAEATSNALKRAAPGLGRRDPPVPPVPAVFLFHCGLSPRRLRSALTADCLTVFDTHNPPNGSFARKSFSSNEPQQSTNLEVRIRISSGARLPAAKPGFCFSTRAATHSTCRAENRGCRPAALGRRPCRRSSIG